MANEYRVQSIDANVLRAGDPAARVLSIDANVLRSFGSATVEAHLLTIDVNVLRSIDPTSSGRRRQMTVIN